VLHEKQIDFDVYEVDLTAICISSGLARECSS
jgi:hypothetical protein